MVRIAAVFPGQGAQYVGMGKKIKEQFPVAARVYQCADDVLGFNLSSLCFDGSEHRLNLTVYAQPAILTTSLAIWEVIKETTGLQPVVLAGLSLGEYTALAVSGALAFEEAISLVHVRGLLMQNAAAQGSGLMMAVMGLEAEKIEAVCQEISGCVEIANYNCPKQLVISGETKAVSQAAALLKAAGGKVAPLPISVPCHSSMLYDAAQSFKSFLEPLSWNKFSIPVVSNYTALEHQEAEIVPNLVSQLYSPVKWEQSVRHMSDYCDHFLEIGPGSSLTGLIKRIEKNKTLGAIEDKDTLEKVMKKVI